MCSSGEPDLTDGSRGPEGPTSGRVRFTFEGDRILAKGDLEEVTGSDVSLLGCSRTHLSLPLKKLGLLTLNLGFVDRQLFIKVIDSIRQRDSPFIVR